MLIDCCTVVTNLSLICFVEDGGTADPKVNHVTSDNVALGNPGAARDGLLSHRFSDTEGRDS